MQTMIECVTDQGMADRNLLQPRDIFVEESKVLQTQIVSCIYA